MDADDLILEIKLANTIGMNPNHNNMPQTNFFISSFNNDFGNSIEAIAKKLYEKYQNYVSLYQYSINGGERGDFSPAEKEEIQQWFDIYK